MDGIRTNKAENTITTFLLDDQPDDNGFWMDWDAIKAGAHKWIGVKGILFRLCDELGCRHDHTGGRNLPEALHLSEEAAVTEIVDVHLDEATHTAYAEQLVLSSEFARKMCSGEVQFVSQSIWLDVPQDDPVHVTVNDGYTPVHLGYVDDPAYGRDKARITDKGTTCNVYSKAGRLSVMDDPKEDPQKEQKMSMEDEVHQMHESMARMEQMLKSMVEQKEPVQEPEKKQESSSRRPSYNFSWPTEKKESTMLCDLVS